MASIIKSKLGVERKCVLLSDSNKGEINKDILDELINNFLTTPYKPEDRSSLQYLEKCWFLFKQDYEIGQVQNQDGSLCAHYPPTLLIPEREKLKVAKPEGKFCEFDPSLDHRRKSESVLDRSADCMCEETTVSRQLLGWVHVEAMGDTDCTRSLDVSGHGDLEDYKSYAFIENSKYENQQNGKPKNECEVC
ncbi:Myotubularin-related protein 14 isoform X2 [Oopsacas minuta]|uniref:Myotubularin-related protein 14 isoform X2 n=1 Tax=Oopsacas minuta TaxID=111878 RepID=A0AAV7K193_9METZ|nr:Myotubularin-related protein 14 isoform X2 [Oopsacas minuta]